MVSYMFSLRVMKCRGLDPRLKAICKGNFASCLNEYAGYLYSVSTWFR